jgi:hypothetical protein
MAPGMRFSSLPMTAEGAHAPVLHLVVDDAEPAGADPQAVGARVGGDGGEHRLADEDVLDVAAVHVRSAERHVQGARRRGMAAD